MPHLNVKRANLYFEDSGNGPETIVFAHGWILDCRMFDEQIAALRSRYRCVSFDFRGHGQSEIAPDGYDMDSLAEETTALIRMVKCAPCHFVGFSMGGFVGMRLAANHPDVLRSLVLIGTSASRERHPLRFNLFCAAAWLLGVRAVTRWIMPVQFGPAFLHDPQRADVRKSWYERIASNHRRASIRAARGIIVRPDYSDPLRNVHVPTLIIAGKDDRATSPSESEKLHALIPGSELALIPEARHAAPDRAAFGSQCIDRSIP